MPSYRVCFINEIPRNDKLFRCCQRSIVIRSARSPERAVEAAKKRFARLEGIRDWKIHAALSGDRSDGPRIGIGQVASQSGAYSKRAQVQLRHVADGPTRRRLVT